MSKVLVDRDLLESLAELGEDAINRMGSYLAEKHDDQQYVDAARAILAQPAEAEGVEPDAFEVARHSKRLVEQLREQLAAVTAERDRLQAALVRATTRHFAQQLRDRTDSQRLDECLSEGIAMLEAENERLKSGALDDLTLRTNAIELMNAANAERDRLRAEAAWIPLTETTPPEGVSVLRWPGWAAEISIDEWCSDHGCFLMDIESGVRATHWKPLRAPDAAAAKEA
jgi:hypothetical protein